MTERSAAEILSLVQTDLRTNQGRQIRHALAWRARRVRNRILSRIDPTHRLCLYSVSVGPNAERVIDTIRRHGQRYGVPAMFGGGTRPTVETVHIGAEHVEAFCRLLLAECTDLTIYSRVPHSGWLEFSRSAVRGANGSFELMVVERRIERERPHVQCSRIEVAVWSRKRGAYGDDFRESDLSFSIVGRLRPPTFDRLVRSGHHFDDDLPAPVQPTFPIDVVYTWVDGDDEAWQRQKECFSSDVGAAVPDRVVSQERFRNIDELKYSLRSLELFAPWVRKVHIVTADQCPPWLDVSHPKVNLVSHREIYADETWLPTFNSSSIETQLHHVPDLADKFLYFNDDVLLGQACHPSDFFYANGILKYFPADTQRAYEGDIDAESEEYLQADRNAIELLSVEMDAVGRTIQSHTPHPSDRELLGEMETKWKEEFAACGAARFRSSADLRPIAFMQFHYGYGLGRALPASISNRYIGLWKPTVIEQLEALGRTRNYRTFCINDVGLQPERTAEVTGAVIRMLEEYFPEPSSFER